MSKPRREKEYFVTEGAGAPEASVLADVSIEGIFRGADGKLYIDRRLKEDEVMRRGLTPRTADINLIGAEIVLAFGGDSQQMD